MNNDEILKRYNLWYTRLTNKTAPAGEDEWPSLPCKIENPPDYLCLYKDIKDYHKTNRTAVCFYEYDDTFDGRNGLFNAIYYNDRRRLEVFKKRFEGVYAVIEPDFSQVRDIELIENKYRFFKARVISLWFLLQMRIPVIPNINYAGEQSFPYMFCGIEDSSMLAFSLKGIMRKPEEIKLLKRVITIAVATTKAKTFLVYSVSRNDAKIREIFSEAEARGINVVVPNNLMKERNASGKGCGQKGNQMQGCFSKKDGE